VPAPELAPSAERADRSLDVLLVIKNTGTLRLLGPVLRGLDARGHRVRIACKEVKSARTHAALQQLTAEHSGVSFTKLPYLFDPGWSELSRSLRRGIDYLRYFQPRYRRATKLRARAEQEAPPVLRRLARLAGSIGAAPALTSVLRGIDRRLLPSPRALAFVAAERPDVLLVAPLIGFGSSQADLVRAARRLGTRCGYPVPSWDNLTNKGLLRDSPDLVLVWNDLQKTEAVELHRVPPERVRVTGSPAYDHWFDWRPSRSRVDFCRQVGLDPEHPIVFYAGSSAFIAPDEPSFVRRWLEALRAHGGALADAGILVRPHPVGVAQWGDFEPDDERATVWPRLGEEPVDTAGRANYFDSIYHSAAVVGINTSAQIEAAIVGRPVHTILAKEYRATQDGTIHFHYLVDPEFGHVRAARTLEEHAAQLERSLEEGDAEGLDERFLRRFVRPFGLEVAATPLAVEAIEELAARPAPAAEREPVAAPLVRLALKPVAERLRRERRRLKRAQFAANPLLAVKRTVRDLADGERPVVAGPWRGDEVGELLYWVPFLRWAATTTLGVSARLIVVARPETAARYAPFAQRVVTSVSEVEGEFDLLEPSLIEPHLGELEAEGLLTLEPPALASGVRDGR
jgi:hypothetical protein